jgi:hypothetical protein
MLSLKVLAPLGAALLLTACAAARAPEYTQDHPANPAAAAAPSATQPSALATYRAAPRVAPAEPTNEDAHAGHH